MSKLPDFVNRHFTGQVFHINKWLSFIKAFWDLSGLGFYFLFIFPQVSGDSVFCAFLHR